MYRIIKQGKHYYGLKFDYYDDDAIQDCMDFPYEEATPVLICKELGDLDEWGIDPECVEF